MKKNFYFKLLFILISILILFYFSVSLIIGNTQFHNVKLLLNDDQKQLLKKYIFPYKLISEQESEINKRKALLLKLELDFKKSGEEIAIKESSIKLSENKILKKFKLISGFYAGTNNKFPGNGYIDFYENNIFVISSRGILAFRDKLINDKENFKQIKNNINDFINIEQFLKNYAISLKDLSIFNQKIYISYVEEIEEDCWNTSVISGDINYEYINFKKIFSSKDCIHSIKNIDREFTPGGSGGRVVKFDDNHILLSIGVYRSRFLAQDKNSVNGKVIKININDNNYEIISMGHRNPQGLYFDEDNDLIFETEHGPQGGDEINLIKFNKINDSKIPNYGWAISSAGEHYGGRSVENKKKYEKYPLYKSHIKHGFIEPLVSFVPSIGISEIVKIEKNKYVVSSLKDRSLYFFELSNENTVINMNRVEVYERIRDLKFFENKLYLFLEDTASIGVINLG